MRYARVNFILMAGCILLGNGCSNGPDEDAFENRKVIRRRQNMVETVDSGVERLKGSAQTNYNSNAGSWSMRSSANDYDYKDDTTFSK